jgi:hypothetical protein
VQVSLLPVDLPHWDQARPGDVICVPVWSDVRPLRGAAGLLDWRLCGRLSSWLASGKVTGADGEQTLFPSGERLPWRLVLAMGAGARAELSDKRLRELVRRMLTAVRGLAVHRVALALPGREIGPGATGATAVKGGPSVRRALDLVLHEVDAQPGVIDDLTVIEAASGHKELAEAMRLRSARA